MKESALSTVCPRTEIGRRSSAQRPAPQPMTLAFRKFLLKPNEAAVLEKVAKATHTARCREGVMSTASLANSRSRAAEVW